MNHNRNTAWEQYEAGKAYKKRLGLYETVRRNERFYRGDQWQGTEQQPLPKPVFNIIRRVMDYLISSIGSADLSIRFSSGALPYADSEEKTALLQRGLDVLDAHMGYRWESCGMSAKCLRLLTDAALTGDGVFYSYWDTTHRTPDIYEGDISTEVIDSVNLFVADVNRADIQSQDYIILSGRATVAALRREAEEAGVPEEERNRIVPDGDTQSGAGDFSRYELEDPDTAKATYIIRFHRENGRVVFEKSTRDCVIRRARTDCRLYPVAYFNWIPTKNSFHGTSPITHLIPNQKFINRAYAMAMKHMTDTAFSKVIYDKSKIPEWSNEVGEAIAAMGGGNVADAVSVVGTGEMQSGYMELIESAVSLTKELMGATESALGNLEASNTSAILALQETSRIPLQQVRTAYLRCVEDLACIWADMICAYYPPERLIPCRGDHGDHVAEADLSVLKNAFLSAHIDVTETARFSASGTQNLLDKLLDGGHITPSEYVSRLPSGLFGGRRALIERMQAEESIDRKETL